MKMIFKNSNGWLPKIASGIDGAFLGWLLIKSGVQLFTILNEWRVQLGFISRIWKEYINQWANVAFGVQFGEKRRKIDMQTETKIEERLQNAAVQMNLDSGTQSSM